MNRIVGTISEMIESLGDGDLTEIPLLQIDAISLEKILRWTHKHKGTEQPTSEEIKNKVTESIDQWDEDFLKMPLRELYDLVANYLLNMTFFNLYVLLFRSPLAIISVFRDCYG